MMHDTYTNNSISLFEARLRSQSCQQEGYPPIYQTLKSSWNFLLQSVTMVEIDFNFNLITIVIY